MCVPYVAPYLALLRQSPSMCCSKASRNTRHKHARRASPQELSCPGPISIRASLRSNVIGRRRLGHCFSGRVFLRPVRSRAVRWWHCQHDILSVLPRPGRWRRGPTRPNLIHPLVPLLLLLPAQRRLLRAARGRRHAAAVLARARTCTGREQVLGKREQRGALGRGRLGRGGPEARGGRLAEHLDHGRDERQACEQAAVTANRGHEDGRPVRRAPRRQADADPAADAPEDEAVEQVDGEDVREQPEEELRRDDLLHPRAPFDHQLRPDGEDQAVELRVVVGREVDGPALHEELAGGAARVPAGLGGREVEARPRRRQVVAQRQEREQDGEVEARVVHAGPGEQPLAVLERDVEVREQQARHEEGAPRARVPVQRDGDGVVAEALPRRLDLAHHDDAEHGLPRALDLHGDGPQHAGAVVESDGRHGIGDQVDELQRLVDESAEVREHRRVDPRGPADGRQVLQPVDGARVHEEVLEQDDAGDGDNEPEHAPHHLLGDGAQVAGAQVLGGQEARRRGEEDDHPDFVEQEGPDRSRDPHLALVVRKRAGLDGGGDEGQHEMGHRDQQRAHGREAGQVVDTGPGLHRCCGRRTASGLLGGRDWRDPLALRAMRRRLHHCGGSRAHHGRGA